VRANHIFGCKKIKVMILKKNNNLKIKNPADNFFNYLHIGEGMQF